MRKAVALKEVLLQSGGILVFRERRITGAAACPTCHSRRQSWVSRLGWVCTACFERYKAGAERLVEVGQGVTRLRQAYELAIAAYQQARAAALASLPDLGSS
jgi:hypothetical protein